MVLVVAYLTIVTLGALLAWGSRRLTRNRWAPIRWFIASLPIGLTIPIVVVPGQIPVPCPAILVLARGLITGSKDETFYTSVRHVGLVSGAVFALGMLTNLMYFLSRIPNRNVRFGLIALFFVVSATIMAILLWIYSRSA